MRCACIAIGASTVSQWNLRWGDIVCFPQFSTKVGDNGHSAKKLYYVSLNTVSCFWDLMPMWWRSVVACMLVAVGSVFSLNFWAVMKCWRYQNRLLGNIGLLGLFVEILGPECLEKEASLAQRELSDHRKNLRRFMQENNSALRRLGAFAFFESLLMFAGSYCLNHRFLGVVLAAFWAGAAIPMTAASKDWVLTQVHRILLYLCKWNCSYPQDCASVVSRQFPNLLPALDIVRLIASPLHR